MNTPPDLARPLANTQLRDYGHDSDAARHVVAEPANNAATHGRVRWGVSEDRFPRKTVRAELNLTAPEPTF